jgi:hypothetical protein
MQAKFAYDGLILSASQVSLLSQQTTKNDACYKSGQN